MGLILVGALYGFPIVVAVTLVRSPATAWEKVLVIIVQAGLTIAYLIALLPAVQ